LRAVVSYHLLLGTLTCSALVSCITSGKSSSIPPPLGVFGLGPPGGPRDPGFDGLDVVEAIFLFSGEK
jgi:hypothetical protein